MVYPGGPEDGDPWRQSPWASWVLELDPSRWSKQVLKLQGMTQREGIWTFMDYEVRPFSLRPSRRGLSDRRIKRDFLEASGKRWTTAPSNSRTPTRQACRSISFLRLKECKQQRTSLGMSDGSDHGPRVLWTCRSVCGTDSGTPLNQMFCCRLQFSKSSRSYSWMIWSMSSE